MTTEVDLVVAQLAAERASQTNEFIRCVNVTLQKALQELQANSFGPLTGTAGGLLQFNGAGSPVTVEGPGQIVGSILGDDAAAGNVGEFITATNGVNVTNGSVFNVVEFTLSPGDWDVSGVGKLALTAGDAFTGMQIFLVETSEGGGTIDQTVSRDYVVPGYSSTGDQDLYTPTPTTRFSLAAPATIFMTSIISFTTFTTTTMVGFIRARRVR